MNRAQRLVVWVGALALLAMCVYPPHVRGKRPEYDWLWEFGSIDTARLGLQCLLVAGVTGLLAYGLRPAAIQALAKRKKLAIQSAVALLAVVVAAVTVGTGLYAVCGVWEALHWWWDSLPPEQVSKISVVVSEWEPPGLSPISALPPVSKPAPKLLSDEEALALPPVSNPKVQAPPAPPPGFVLDTPTGPVSTPKVQSPAAPAPKTIQPPVQPKNPPALIDLGPAPATPAPRTMTDEEFFNEPATPQWARDGILLAHQQQGLVVKNGSGVALRAISIRIYYPGVPVPSTYDRLPCLVSLGGQADVTVLTAHDCTPRLLRVEVVGAWRQ